MTEQLRVFPENMNITSEIRLGAQLVISPVNQPLASKFTHQGAHISRNIISMISNQMKYTVGDRDIWSWDLYIERYE